MLMPTPPLITPSMFHVPCFPTHLPCVCVGIGSVYSGLNGYRYRSRFRYLYLSLHRYAYMYVYLPPSLLPRMPMPPRLLKQVPEPPTHIAFSCVIPSAKGGATPIILSHVVYEHFNETYPEFCKKVGTEKESRQAFGYIDLVRICMDAFDHQSNI